MQQTKDLSPLGSGWWHGNTTQPTRRFAGETVQILREGEFGIDGMADRCDGGSMRWRIDGMAIATSGRSLNDSYIVVLAPSSVDSVVMLVVNHDWLMMMSWAPVESLS